MKERPFHPLPTIPAKTSGEPLGVFPEFHDFNHEISKGNRSHELIRDTFVGTIWPIIDKIHDCPSMIEALVEWNSLAASIESQLFCRCDQMRLTLIRIQFQRLPKKAGVDWIG